MGLQGVTRSYKVARGQGLGGRDQETRVKGLGLRVYCLGFRV
jgi:hypothetical protein